MNDKELQKPITAELDENFSVKEEVHTEEDIKRKLLGLPQQLSLSSGKSSNRSSNGDTSNPPDNKSNDKDKKKKDDKKDNNDNDNDNDKKQDSDNDSKKDDDNKKDEPKNKDSNNTTDRRKKRDDNKLKRNKDAKKKSPNSKKQGGLGKTKDQLAKLTKDSAKNGGKNGLRNGLRGGLKNGAKNAAKKGAKKAGKKAAKVAAKALKKVLVKGIALISKALLTLIGTIGLPAILILLAIVVLIVILMVVSSVALGTGEGQDTFDENTKEIRSYIVELSNASVDPNVPEQAQYRVPEELLAALVQLESFLSENGNDGSISKMKTMLKEMADALKPSFTYETYTEWTQTSSKVCVETETVENEDGTTTEKCVKKEWSSPTKTEKKVNLITSVTAWNGSGSYEYEAEESDWVVNGDTKTKTKEYVMKEQSFENDFAKLDSVLNGRGYGMEDKKWFEFFYESATGLQMGYTTWLETGSVPEGMGFGGGYNTFDGTITAGGGVPAQYMPYYLAAEAKYGIPWNVLAAVHFVETSFGTSPSMVSSAGAIGHMQFMPKTWVGWSYPGSTIPMNVVTNPSMIKRYGGYGTDANGDGKADPYDPEDAIHTAAKYLKASGYASSPRNGIFAYNHADWYVDKVLKQADVFKNAATYTPNTGAGSSKQVDVKDATGVVKVMLTEAYKYLGTPYQWGGSKPSTNFDCSGLIQWSYKKAGINLPRTSREQYKFTTRITASQAKAGDLVFFCETPGSGYITHVGIYLGGGMMLNSQNRGVIVQPISDWGKKVYAYGHIPGVQN